jgi:hypothetical protein
MITSAATGHVLGVPIVEALEVGCDVGRVVPSPFADYDRILEPRVMRAHEKHSIGTHFLGLGRFGFRMSQSFKSAPTFASDTRICWLYGGVVTVIATVTDMPCGAFGGRLGTVAHTLVLSSDFSALLTVFAEKQRTPGEYEYVLESTVGATVSFTV